LALLWINLEGYKLFFYLLVFGVQQYCIEYNTFNGEGTVLYFI